VERVLEAPQMRLPQNSGPDIHSLRNRL
jgi:hypothetical protein